MDKQILSDTYVSKTDVVEETNTVNTTVSNNDTVKKASKRDG